MNKIRGILKNYNLKIQIFLLRCLLLILIIFVISHLNLLNSFEAIELSLYDLRTQVFLKQGNLPTADDDIVLLVHNDQSQSLIEKHDELDIKRWPWHRLHWAKLLKYLRSAPNKVSAFDIKFPSSDRDIDDQEFSKELQADNNFLACILTQGDYIANIDKIPDYSKDLFKQTLEKTINRKQYEKKLKHIPYENFIQLDEKDSLSLKQKNITPLKSIYFDQFIGINKLFLDSVKHIGAINVTKSSENNTNSSIRENQPIYKYKPYIYKEEFKKAYNKGIVDFANNLRTSHITLRDKSPEETKKIITENYIKEFRRKEKLFGFSLPLAIVNYVLGDKDNLFKFENNIFGQKLYIGDREFPLTERGTIYINWRPRIIKNNNKIEREASSGSIKTYPIAAAFLFYVFEYFDPITGFYKDPDTENFKWQSNFNYLLSSPLDEFYFDYLSGSYKYTISNVKTKERSNNVMIMDFFKKFQFKDNKKNNVKEEEEYIYALKEIYEVNIFPESYKTHLMNIIRGDSSYKLIDFLNNYKNRPNLYKYPDFTLNRYTYNNITDKYYLKTNKILYNDLITKFFYNSKHNFFLKYNLHEENPKIAGIPIKQILEKRQSNNYYLLQKNYLPIWDYIDKQIKQSLHFDNFINKITVIGECTSGGDIHENPISSAYPGPEVIATVIDNYLNDGTPERRMIHKTLPWIDFLFIIFFGWLTAYAVIKSPNYFNIVIVLCSITFIFILLNFILFLGIGGLRLWVSMIYPIAIIIIISVITLIYKIKVIDKDKNEIKDLFGKFVAPQVLQAILENPKMLTNKVANRKIMTVMFCDIRDFTTRSEQVSPEELVTQINEYFTEIVEVIIMKYNGTLDKYMGDAVMAFWGDPVPVDDHPLRAVLTALLILDHLELLNKKWRAKGKSEIKIGIGINTGEMIVGHIGSPRLIDYTVLGDNVNIASRLETLNREYPANIIISESTYQHVKDYIEVEPLGNVQVKGKTETVNIFSVLKLKENIKVDYEKPTKLFIEKVD